MIQINEMIYIAKKDIHFDFIRGSGPGGQKINKVASAVQLRYDILNSSLPEDVKKKLKKTGGSKITKNGELVIEAKRFRTQQQNREDALNRLIVLIQGACRKEKPHIKTQVSRAAKEQRLVEKKKQGIKKKYRQKLSKSYDD